MYSGSPGQVPELSWNDKLVRVYKLVHGSIDERTYTLVNEHVKKALACDARCDLRLQDCLWLVAQLSERGKLDLRFLIFSRYPRRLGVMCDILMKNKAALEALLEDPEFQTSFREQLMKRKPPVQSNIRQRRNRPPQDPEMMFCRNPEVTLERWVRIREKLKLSEAVKENMDAVLSGQDEREASSIQLEFGEGELEFGEGELEFWEGG